MNQMRRIGPMTGCGLQRGVTLLVLIAVAFLGGGETPLHAQQATFTCEGRVTVDGLPAPPGTLVSVRVDGSTTPLVTVTTGSHGLPDDSYSIALTGFDAPPENTFVTITADGFGEVTPVRARYAYNGAFVTADIAAYTSRRVPLPDPGEGQAFIEMPQFINISPESTGLDGNGHPVEMIGGTLRLEFVGEQVNVPVVLLGGTLESLDDPVSGISIRRVDDQMLIRIPFKDEEGSDTIRFLVDVQHLSGKGSTASGEIAGLRIDAPTRSRDFTEFDERVGTGSVKVLGNINSFPGDSFLEMNILPAPTRNDSERLADALIRRDEEVAESAFTVEFAKTKLDPALEEITLRLTVGRDWYLAQPVDSVVVARLGDDGEVQFFPFIPVDPQADPVRFDLVSPDGLSAFVIIAVRDAIKPTPIPTATSTPSPTPAPTTTSPATSAPTSQPTSTAIPRSGTPVIPDRATSSTAPSPRPSQSAISEPETAEGGSCNARSGGVADVGHVSLILSPFLLMALRRKIGASTVTEIDAAEREISREHARH